MLRDVSLQWCKEGHAVSVIGRNPVKLDRLRVAATDMLGCIHTIGVDYTQTNPLIYSINAAISRLGPIQVTVAWIRSDRTEVHKTVAKAVTSTSTTCRYFEILGSSSGDPSQPREHGSINRFPGISYRQIILGFIIEGTTSRWLTNDEICKGVIEAVARDRELTIIGVLEPWRLRPS